MTSSRIPDLSGEELFRRISDPLTGGRFPLSGQWELTCRCNLECVMCYTDPFNTPERIQQELSYPEIARVLEELREAGCVELCFTGGEPLARKDFLDIYSNAKQKGFLLTVFTNGTLITPEMADYWVQYPPKMVEISLHGLDPHSFDSITQGPGSHRRCMRGIELILDRSLPLTLKTTGMTVNRDEIMEIKDYVDRLGKVQYKFGSEIRVRLDGSEDVYEYQLDQDEITEIERSDDDFCAERVRQDELREKAVQQDQDLCAGGKYKFHIDAYGRLQLCSMNRRQSYDLRQGSSTRGSMSLYPAFPVPPRPWFRWRRSIP